MEALFKNIPLTLLVVTGLLVGAVVVGGMVISLLSNLFTGFVARTSPSEKTMNDWNNRQLKSAAAQLDVPKRISFSPSAEPLVLSAMAFVTTFILSQIFVTVQPEVKDCFDPKFDADPECIKVREEAKVRLKLTKDQKGAEELVVSLPAGDAATGKVLFEDKGCVGCHSLNKGQVNVGPSFYGVYTRAATRKPGYSAEQYLYESIVNPNLLVVEGFQPNIMQNNYVKTINKTEMAHILAWMKAANAQTD